MSSCLFYHYLDLVNILLCLQTGAIIVTPTRELALQIDEVLGSFLEELPQFTKLLLIGGVNPLTDIKRIQEQG